MSLRGSSYIAPMLPKKGAQKRKKIAPRLKKVCYKVFFLCDNCLRQGCKAFIGLTIRAKNDWWGNPFYLKFWVKLTALEQNRRFSIYFCHVAPQP